MLVDPIAREAEELCKDGGGDELLGAAAVEDTDAPALRVFLASFLLEVEGTSGRGDVA